MVDRFVSSGSTLLDNVLGGGWALGRMGHIIGSPSTNKTGLCIELCANMKRSYNNSVIYYCDGESAFDPEYAAKLGMPQDGVVFTQPTDPDIGLTVEDFDRHLSKAMEDIRKKKDGDCGVFVLDSLDSLPMEKEATTALEDRSGYGAEKAKILAEIFRTKVQAMTELDLALIIISQTRDKIGATYGPKETYSGGKALSFYASQQIWLKKVQTLKKDINGVEMAYGVRVEAKNTKNKVGPPFRKCEYNLIFGYGIDDLNDNLEFLKQIKKLDILPDEIVSLKSNKEKKTDSIAKIKENLYSLSRSDQKQIIREIQSVSRMEWTALQEQLEASLPQNKYMDDVDDQ